MIRRAFLCSLLFAAGAALAEPAPDPKILAELRRYLHAIHFAEAFQGGIRKHTIKVGHSTKFLDRMMAAPPGELEATIAPAYAPHVTLEQAREIADFYSSPVGQKCVALGMEQIDGVKKAPELTLAERLEVTSFGLTPAGRIALKFQDDTSIRDAYTPLLKLKYGD